MSCLPILCCSYGEMTSVYSELPTKGPIFDSIPGSSFDPNQKVGADCCGEVVQVVLAWRQDWPEVQGASAVHMQMDCVPGTLQALFPTAFALPIATAITSFIICLVSSPSQYTVAIITYDYPSLIQDAWIIGSYLDCEWNQRACAGWYEQQWVH